ncbi:MAG: hypothetical protein ACT6Q5_00970 [Sphingopyxis solisilvae]|uniref:hypothetical protein n=1 Tax=Sphingopyxis solisilvae TaxID=1886788 RepID=UPI004036E47E
MMLAAFFLIAAQPTVADTARADALEDDIVVIARKMTEWRGSVKWNGDMVTCKTTKSTKNAMVDKLGCDAMIFCTTPDVRAEVDSLKDRKISKAERARRGDLVGLQVNECAEERAHILVAAWLEQRRAAE